MASRRAARPFPPGNLHPHAASFSRLDRPIHSSPPRKAGLSVPCSSSSSFDEVLSPHSWIRSAVSSAGLFVESTLSQVAAATTTPGAEKQGWDEWMREWRPGRKGIVKGMESVQLLPGWAVQRYRSPRKAMHSGGYYAFSLES